MSTLVLGIETVADGEKILVVVLRTATIPGVAALQEKVRFQRSLDGAGYEMRAVVSSDGRGVVLNAGQQLPAEGILEAARQLHGTVRSEAEGAVELRLVYIGAHK